jgi:myo-inositol-1(or 4)-monophosphatase
VIRIAELAAREAGEILLSYWRNLPQGSISEKGKNDFVSRADRESEAAIVHAIGGSLPEDGILAEEGARRRGTSGREWVIDPLDGTSNFIAGFPFWCVSIGAREKGRLVGGVIWDPLRGEMYAAEHGAGAYRNGERIGVSAREELDGAFLATGFPFRSRDRIDDYLAVFRALFLRARAIRRAGSAALDLANVAAGVFDGFFEFRLSPWDIAAGAVLVAEAGGEVRDFAGSGDFLATGNVVAGAPGVVGGILAETRRIGRDPGGTPPAS